MSWGLEALARHQIKRTKPPGTIIRRSSRKEEMENNGLLNLGESCKFRLDRKHLKAVLKENGDSSTWGPETGRS